MACEVKASRPARLTGVGGVPLQPDGRHSIQDGARPLSPMRRAGTGLPSPAEGLGPMRSWRGGTGRSHLAPDVAVLGRRRWRPGLRPAGRQPRLAAALPYLLALFLVGRDRHARRRLHLQRHRRCPDRRRGRAHALAPPAIRPGHEAPGLDLPRRQALLALPCSLQFSEFAIIVGLCSLAVVAIYPFMKRITDWPQLVLGFAFSWGALMGWAQEFDDLDGPAIMLFLGSVCWVIGYDTIYAHQDREDDALVGVRSTARLFGENTQVVAGRALRRGARLLRGRLRGCAGAHARAGRAGGGRRTHGAPDHPARHRRPGAMPRLFRSNSENRLDDLPRARRRACGWLLKPLLPG